MSEQSIKVHSCMLSELFDPDQPTFNYDIRGELTIPEYQRPYQWGKPEIDNLIKDLKSYFNEDVLYNNAAYYLGTIILHKTENQLRIIDGQQRLTTLALLQWVKYKVVPNIRFDSPISKYQIQKNRNYINELDLQQIDLSKLNLTLVVTSNEDEAYTFFETQNTGGIRLGGEDIIKAHHLRAIPEEGGQRNNFASIWEGNKNLPTVIRYLLKIRAWSMLDWKNFPKNNYKKKYKETVISEFSVKANRDENFAYQQIIVDRKSYPAIPTQISFPYAPKQPLSSGEGFINYLDQFVWLYNQLFIDQSSIYGGQDYNDMIRKILKYQAGVQYITPLYKKALICYVYKFGFSKLFEAALYIYRVVFSIRLISQKIVKESSIPTFLRDTYNILDKVLYAHDHEELIEELISYQYNIHPDNLNKGVKKTYLEFVKEIFKLEVNVKRNFSSEYDKELLNAFRQKMNRNGEN